MAKLNLNAKIRRAWATSKHFLVKQWRWILFVLALVFVVLIYPGYWVPWTGFGGREDAKGEWLGYKTLWDWMDLLVVPALLAIAAFLLNRAANRRALERELDRAHEAAWQAYLDQMAKLLLERGLRASDPDADVRCIARARTLAVLRQLDGEHKGSLVQFLYDSKLIEKQEPVVVLDRADLSGVSLCAAHLEESDFEGAYLEEADLGFANLSGANLSNATLKEAILRGTVLSETNLTGADLRRADLSGADLRSADLRGAKVTREQLAQAKNLEGTTLPDGTEYTGEAEPAQAQPEPEEQAGDLDAGGGSDA